MITLILALCFSNVFAECLKIDKEGGKSKYKGEDLKSIFYTCEYKSIKKLRDKYPSSNAILYIFTGDIVPCNGEDCQGKRHVKCNEN